MNLSAPFIRRPVMTTLLMMALLLFGIISYRVLPVSQLPNVDFPTIQVTGVLPGASPETMASSVATPLERQLTTIAGIDSMTSTSTEGQTQITIQFTLDRNIDAAAQDVQAAIAQAQGDVPAEMPSPPSYRKVNSADQPVLYIALSSATLPLARVHEYADTLIAQRLSTVSGVAEVQVFGAQKYAVRVQLDPRILAARGIGLDEVEGAVRQANPNLPTGTLEGPEQAFTVGSTGQLTSAAAYRPVIIAYRDGAPVRLQQLGRVLDSVENDKVASWFNGVSLGEAIARIQEAAQELGLPDSITTSFLSAAQEFQESLAGISFLLLVTILVIYLVLGILYESFIHPLTILSGLPSAAIGALLTLLLFGMDLDFYGIIGVILLVGIVKKNAIMMIDFALNAQRQGRSAREAIYDGALARFRPIVMTTLAAIRAAGGRQILVTAP
jgi:HAE1 family hydrophobic/amphiphilic exporter-1